MERLQQQIAVVSEELAAIKSELINVKAAHAGLHQSSVESNTNTTRTLTEVIARIEGIEEKGPVYSGAPTRKALIEPKQVQVDIFAGAVTDSRSKFLEWGETVKDRAWLFAPILGQRHGKGRSRS